MAANLTMVRIATKLDDLFNEKIDISDVKTSDDDRSTFYSRAIAALSIMIQCGIDETLSGSCVTDGYHDMGIDAVYNDSTQKKLVLVQSKWRRDGTGGISQEEAGSFAQGVKRIINSEFEGCNAKISAKQTDIIAALKDMDYQIEVIFCHTGNQCITDYSKRPITDLLKQVNEEDVAEILVFKEIKLQDIYDFLASSQALDDITIDDVILSNWGTIDEPFKAYYGSIPASAVGECISVTGIGSLLRIFATTKEALMLIKVSKRYYEQNQRSFSIITTELNSYAVKSQEKRHIVLIELRGCLRLKEYHW